jgi:hypothetical protein
LTASASLTSTVKLNKAAKATSLLSMLRTEIYIFVVVMSYWGIGIAGVILFVVRQRIVVRLRRFVGLVPRSRSRS